MLWPREFSLSVFVLLKVGQAVAQQISFLLEGLCTLWMLGGPHTSGICSSEGRRPGLACLCAS